MIALVEGAIRQRTPNEIALSLVLSAFTLIFLIVTATLWPMARHAEQYMKDYRGIDEPVKSLGTDVPTLVALLVCLIPTTIGALLAAIGIAGMDRALRANIIAKSGKAVEVAGDVDTLLLDKTGTITVGNRRATQFVPRRRHSRPRRRPARRPGLGRPIRRRKARALSSCSTSRRPARPECAAAWPRRSRRRPFIEFTAQTRMSGVDLPDGRRIRKGRPDAMLKLRASSNGGTFRPTLTEARRRVRLARGDAAAGLRGQQRSPAWSCWKTSSSPACASASNGCGRWACAR